MTDLLPALLAEHQPTTTLERHLTEQLAHVLAKQATAEDNETHLLAKQPQYLLTHRPDGHLVPDPAYLLYNNRLDAMRLHQARLGREQSRILRELHRLKRTPLVPKAASEPKRPAVALKEKMSWVADIMADYDRRAAANEPGSAASRANEPKPAPAANEPGNRSLPASEPTHAPTRAANEPAPPASPRLDRGVNGQGSAVAHPQPWMARSSRAKAEGVGPALRAAANEPSSTASCASEPTPHLGPATPDEPRAPAVTTARAASEPSVNPSPSPLASVRQPVAVGLAPGSSDRTPGLKERLAGSSSRGTPASEPAHSWPVLSDAEADRIEAMIHSGDDAQLKEAARLLGIMDPKAPVPPSLLALARSKLAG